MQQVAPGLYVSRIEDAGNPEKLTSRGITAVLKLTHGSPSEPYPERVRSRVTSARRWPTERLPELQDGRRSARLDAAGRGDRARTLLCGEF